MKLYANNQMNKFHEFIILRVKDSEKGKWGITSPPKEDIFVEMGIRVFLFGCCCRHFAFILSKTKETLEQETLYII